MTQYKETQGGVNSGRCLESFNSWNNSILRKNFQQIATTLLTRC